LEQVGTVSTVASRDNAARDETCSLRKNERDRTSRWPRQEQDIAAAARWMIRYPAWQKYHALHNYDGYGHICFDYP
jgi:hypothetical protein